MKWMLSIRKVSPALAFCVVLISPAAADNVANLKASSAQMSRIPADSSPEAARAAAFSGHQTMMGAKGRGAVNARDYGEEYQMERLNETVQRLREASQRLRENYGLKTTPVPAPLSIWDRQPSLGERI